MEAASKPTRRIVELDALRALAAINLMLFHFTHVYSVKYGYSSPLGLEFPWGKYGVQLFFMLSGVVNALTLMKKRSPGDFLAARTLRILPSYYIVLGLNLILLGMAPIALHQTCDFRRLLANLTVMPNLFGEECLEPVMWTLQVEVLFYGVLLFLFWRGWLDRPLKAIGGWLVLCLVGCPGIDALTGAWPDGPLAGGLGIARQVLLLDYFPLFAVGILLHDLWRDRSRTWRNLIGIAGALTVFHVTDTHGHNPVVSLGLTALLGLGLFGWLPALRWRPLVFVSSISYMLYLLHDNLGSVAIWWMDRSLGLPPMACFLLSLPATVAVSALATWCLERPVTAFLRGRWQAWRRSPGGISRAPNLLEPAPLSKGALR